MGRFRTTLLTCGEHESPEGKVVVTPARLRHFADTHREMRQAGIKHPACWGHHLSSVPQYPADVQFDAQQYLGSMFNCGYMPQLIVEGNNLDAVFDVPGAEVDGDGNLITWQKDPDSGNLLKCAIKEVSPAIMDEFRDGRGRVWTDIIGHGALVPHPVQASQTGFTALSTTRLPGGITYIKPATEAKGWKMLGAGSRAGKFGDDEADEDADLADELTPGADDDVEVEEPAAGGGDDGSEYAKVAAIVDKLADVAGIHLPGATTKEDLIEHLNIILDHMSQAGMQPMGAENPEGSETNGAPVVAEQAPMMMSVFRDDTIITAIKQKYGTEAEKIIAAGLNIGQQAPRLGKVNVQLLGAETERRRKVQTKLLARVSQYVPAEVMSELEIKPETMMLSATRAGDIVEPKAFSVTELLRIMLAAVKGMPNAKLTRTLSTATEHTNPLRRAKPGEVTDAEATEMAEKIAGRKFKDPAAKPSRNGNGKHERRRR